MIRNVTTALCLAFVGALAMQVDADFQLFAAKPIVSDRKRANYQAKSSGAINVTVQACTNSESNPCAMDCHNFTVPTDTCFAHGDGENRTFLNVTCNRYITAKRILFEGDECNTGFASMDREVFCESCDFHYYKCYDEYIEQYVCGDCDWKTNTGVGCTLEANLTIGNCTTYTSQNFGTVTSLVPEQPYRARHDVLFTWGTDRSIGCAPEGTAGGMSVVSGECAIAVGGYTFSFFCDEGYN